MQRGIPYVEQRYKLDIKVEYEVRVTLALLDPCGSCDADCYWIDRRGVENVSFARLIKPRLQVYLN